MQVVELIENVKKEDENTVGAKVAFLMFDTNKDGYIEQAEIIRSLKILLGVNLEVSSFMSFYDANKDGKLDFNEVSSAWKVYGPDNFEHQIPK